MKTTSFAARAALLVLTATALMACGAKGVEGETVPTGDLTLLRISSGVCGAAPSKCAGSSVEVDFGTSYLSTSGCKGDERTTSSRLLSASDLDGIRNALGEVRVESQPVTDQDGFQERLTLVRGSVTDAYNYPNARCGDSSPKNVIAGWGTLNAALIAK